MKERLQKILSARGVCSRRAAERLLAQGRITVNGVRAEVGESADAETDAILLDGAPLPGESAPAYIMLNKPRGYITAMSDHRGRPTVAELTADAGGRLYPVGRLDLDSDGLLILTNDGDMAHKLMHPSHGVEKTYRVEVSGRELGAALPELRAEMELDGQAVRAKRVDILSPGVISVTIGEGRKRQVRRMCALCGLRVSRLTRVAEGELRLGGLPPGKWRPLAENEIQFLQKLR